MVPLSRTNIFLLLTLFSSNLFATLAFSVPSPFLPGAVLSKGLSLTVAGLIIGEFELVIFIVSPFVVYIAAPVGIKFVYICGICICSTSLILFSALEACPPGNIFGVMCFLTRGFAAFGAAFFLVASCDILARTFPDRVSTMIGALETAQGLGYTVGPAIGGILYDVGGFRLPFLTVGALMLATTLPAVLATPAYYTAKAEDNGNGAQLWKLLTIPLVLATLLAYCSSGALYGAQNAMLEPYLAETFHFAPRIIGIMFLLPSLTYTISAFLWGYLTDSMGWGVGLIIFGLILSVFSAVLMNPSNFLFMCEPSLFTLLPSLLLLGFATSCIMVPAFGVCLESALKNGFDESSEITKFIAGLVTSFYSFGVFIGPATGGRLYEAWGFGNLLLGYAALFSMFAILLTIVCAMERRQQNKPKYSVLQSECSDVDVDSNQDSDEQPQANSAM